MWRNKTAEFQHTQIYLFQFGNFTKQKELHYSFCCTQNKQNLSSVQYNVLRSSGISQKSGALIVRYSQKKECIYFCFLLF